MNTSSSASRFSRKQFFLWHSAQPRLLLGIELIFLVLLGLTGFIFYLIAHRNLTGTYFQAHLRIKNVLDILLPSLLLIHLGGLAAGAVLTVFFTHRIAGPVHRLCRILRQAGQGHLAQTVQFRQNDELKELDDAATEMLAALSARVRTLRALTAQLQDRAATAAENPALRGVLAPLASDLHQLESELAAFRLPSEAEH